MEEDEDVPSLEEIEQRLGVCEASLGDLPEGKDVYELVRALEERVKRLEGEEKVEDVRQRIKTNASVGMGIFVIVCGLSLLGFTVWRLWQQTPYRIILVGVGLPCASYMIVSGATMFVAGRMSREVES